MPEAYGGGAAVNPASPSSHDACVAKIVETYVRPGSRILDVGGTAHGFAARAALPEGCSLVIVNPEGDHPYKWVRDIRIGGEAGEVRPFDLAMMFGVMLYWPRESVVKDLRDIRERLARGGVLLLAEPSPEGAAGTAEKLLKKGVEMASFGYFKFYFHTLDEACAMLKEAGFAQVRERRDLSPWAMGIRRLPPYYVVEARV